MSRRSGVRSSKTSRAKRPPKGHRSDRRKKDRRGAGITVAAIDIGTNSIHMIVARMETSGIFRVIDTDKVPVRLGKYLDKSGNLTPEGIRRTTETVRHMNALCRGYGAAPRVLATHAVREAANHHKLLDAIRRATKLSVEIIDGFEEARMMYLGIRYGFDVEQDPCLAMDIGGGSTEIIIARGDTVRYVGSLKVGAVIMTKRFFGDKDPSPGSVRKLAEHLEEEVAPIVPAARRHSYVRAFAASGTAKALAQIHARICGTNLRSDANAYELPGNDLIEIVKDLKKIRTTKKIRDQYQIDSGRADILLAGAMIMGCVTEMLHVRTWTISTFGLREGILVDSHRRSHGFEFGDMRDDRWLGVIEYARRLGIDHDQAEHVAHLAIQLFDGLARKILAKQTDAHIRTSRDLLRVSAYLREAGMFLSLSRYHKHSNYLIANSRLLGFTQNELELMGLAAQYQRKGVLSALESEAEHRTADEIKLINLFAGCIRLAGSLDRSRTGRVRRLDVRWSKGVGRILIRHVGRTPPHVEMHKCETDLPGVEKLLGVRLIMKPMSG